MPMGIFDSVSCDAFDSNRDGDSLNVRHIASSTALPTYSTGICLILISKPSHKTTFYCTNYMCLLDSLIIDCKDQPRQV